MNYSNYMEMLSSFLFIYIFLKIRKFNLKLDFFLARMIFSDCFGNKFTSAHV